MRNEIKKALQDIEYPEVVEALQVYAEEGRPYALPSFKPQDRASAKHRTADLLGGFPFTSDAYPWPVGGVDGLHMQPLIQINLGEAGDLLGFDFGVGLLQVWGAVGKGEGSFNVIDMAFDPDKSKGIFLRVVPVEELKNEPSDFFPDFAPWVNRADDVLGKQPGLLFIEPSEEASRGSLIEWKLVDEFMYPTPDYEMHDVQSLVPEPAEQTEGVDSWDLFQELSDAVSLLLKTPFDGGYCYLGGVRGYRDGRHRDPAQGFPLLLSFGGDVNLSVVFDDSITVKPDRSVDDGTLRVHFARERKLRAVYSYRGL